MDYYVDHGDLLVNSVGWNIPLLNETLQYMVNWKIHSYLPPSVHFKVIP